MLASSSLAFFEIHKLPTFKLPTLVKAFSIFEARTGVNFL